MDVNTPEYLRNWLIHKCAKSGIKITGPRRVILEVLIQSNDHPDVEMIHSRASHKDRRISLATAYRAVKLFQDSGLIARHEFGDGRARYEISPRQHHDHLIDLQTGEVIEFRDDEIEKLQEIVATRLGYKLTGHRLELFGHKLTSADTKNTK